MEFAKAIRASDNPDPELEYIVTSINEWQTPRDRRARSRKASERTPDEGREGFSYRLLRWPAFVCDSAEIRIDATLDSGSWLVGMARVCYPIECMALTYFRLCYAGVRIYVNLTEFFITW